MTDYFSKVGNWVLATIDNFSSFCAYTILVIKTLFQKKSGSVKEGRAVLSKQVLFTGINAIPLIALVSLALGGIAIIQTFTLLPKFGGESLVGKILVTVIIRELGPVLTGFIVIGRSGTAITTEIGNMMVSHEIEALESMGIDPVRYIIIPRIFGVTASLVSLNIYFDIFAIIGGYLVSKMVLITSISVFLRKILEAMIVSDITVSIIKGFIFGIVISLICTFMGLSVKFSSTEVPQMTSKAVVISIAFMFILDGIITFIYYA